MIQKPYFWVYIQKKCSQKDTNTLISIAALFEIIHTWYIHNPLTDKYMKKMCYKFMMEYFQQKRKQKNKVLLFVTIQMTLEGIAISKISHIERKLL